MVYAFSGDADGEYLDTDLVTDNAGDLYGTTVHHGSGSGTVVQLAPSASGWTHRFLGVPAQAWPTTERWLNSVGNFYGATGPTNDDTIDKFTP